MSGARGGGAASSSSDEGDGGGGGSPDFPYPVIYKLIIALAAVFGAAVVVVTVERAIYSSYTKEVLSQVDSSSTDHTTHNGLSSSAVSGGAAMLNDFSTHSYLVEAPLSPSSRGPPMASEI